MTWQFGATWQLEAKCGDREPERFAGRGGGEWMCPSCPVREQCLEFALESPWQPYGIWGGLSQQAVVKLWRDRHPRASRADALELMGLA